jgi:transposase-like protein
MKTTINEKPEPKPAVRPTQRKRYEEACKKQAVEHWLQSGKPGTHIACELGGELPNAQAVEARLLRRRHTGAPGSGKREPRAAGRTGPSARVA